MKRLTTVAMGLSLFLSTAAYLCACEEKSPEPPQNIALGKSYSLSARPEYGLCTDPDDKIQLADGKTTTGYFWTQKGTVGWTRAGSVAITIDLGKVEPIDRVAFTSAAGVAGVTWPAAAIVLVSEDGKDYYETCGNFLSDEQKRNGVFDNNKYSIRKLTSSPLSTRGRFVRLYLFSSGPFLFTDEVEIYRGTDRCMKRPLGKKATSDIQAYGDQCRLSSAVQSRYLNDVTAVHGMIQEAVKLGYLDELKKNVLQQRVNRIRGQLLELPPPESKGFRAILPLSEDHAKLLAIQARLWNAAGMPALAAEVVNRWELLPLVGRFPGNTTKANLDLLRGESRPIAVNLYNSTSEPLKATVTASAAGKGAGPKVEFALVPWTDTNRYIPVQAAIVDLARTGSKSDAFDILPGVPCQLWVTVDSHGTAAGTYPINPKIEASDGTQVAVDTVVKVYPFDMPAKSSLLVGGWDYTDKLPAYSVSQKCIDSFMKVCRQHHVNAPWSQSRTMFSCSVQGNPKALTVDTKLMEDWLARWSDAKEYFVFLAVGKSFCGFQHGTPEFDHWVGQWARFWSDWFKGRKIDPSRVSLLVFDEPGLHSNKDTVGMLCDWARAIKKANSGMRIWEDPVYTPPTKGPAELFEVSDTLCPNRPQWLADPKNFEAFYLAEQKKGKTLHFYSCSGPLRLLDPYHYCLLQAWHCFKLDAKASFFWALTDGGGYSCWNEYVLPRNAYCPMFIDPEDPVVYSAKQMAAIKESVQDYETLTLLKKVIADARAKGKASAQVDQAAKTLEEGVERVLSAPEASDISWNKPGQRDAADAVRNQVLNLLIELTR
ncbi:MAG: discoidin domain-containing protein [Thermoguttaceae bacterium]|nr:discoidin domain-containing protein [Thermoguttaceae bacterium]